MKLFHNCYIVGSLFLGVVQAIPVKDEDALSSQTRQIRIPNTWYKMQIKDYNNIAGRAAEDDAATFAMKVNTFWDNFGKSENTDTDTFSSSNTHGVQTDDLEEQTSEIKIVEIVEDKSEDVKFRASGYPPKPKETMDPYPTIPINSEADKVLHSGHSQSQGQSFMNEQDSHYEHAKVIHPPAEQSESGSYNEGESIPYGDYLPSVVYNGVKSPPVQTVGIGTNPVFVSNNHQLPYYPYQSYQPQLYPIPVKAIPVNVIPAPSYQQHSYHPGGSKNVQLASRSSQTYNQPRTPYLTNVNVVSSPVPVMLINGKLVPATQSVLTYPMSTKIVN